MRASKAVLSLGGLIACAVGSVSALRLNETRHIFAFGDSYTAVGYDPSKGLLPQDQPIKTLSGGLNWINFIAQDYGLTNTTFDLAHSSATTDRSIVDSWAPSLVEQVDSFLRYFSPPPAEVSWEGSSTLFPIFIGINDNGHAREQNKSFPSLLSSLREAQDEQVRRLYEAGARHFLLMGLPPMERSPYVLAFPKTEREVFGSHLSLYNAYLEAYASTFGDKYEGATALYYDTASLVSGILDNLEESGFKDAGFCGAYAHLDQDPSAYDRSNCTYPLAEYVFYDAYHLSWSAQKLLGEGVQAALEGAETRSVKRRAEPEVKRGGRRSRHFGRREWRWAM